MCVCVRMCECVYLNVCVCLADNGSTLSLINCEETLIQLTLPSFTRQKFVPDVR